MIRGSERPALSAVETAKMCIRDSYRALLDMRPKEYIDNIVNFYDYLEIQPVGNNMFMIDSDRIPAVNSVEDIKAVSYTHLDVYKRQFLYSMLSHILKELKTAFRRLTLRKETASHLKSPIWILSNVFHLSLIHI